MTTYEKTLVEKLNKLINEKYINSESISDNLCLDLGISRSNLYRLLKENFALSPSLYIRKQKLIKAKELLDNTDMKIGEIAYYIGLDSPQNFTKYFTQEHGTNPTEYRKKLNIGKQKNGIAYETDEPLKHIPLKKRKKTFNESISFYIPGIIVFALLTIGFYYWQKNYFNAEISINEQPKNTIAIVKFDCNEINSNYLYCDSIYKELNISLTKIENLSLLTSNETTKKEKQNIPNHLANQLNVTYLLLGKINKKQNSIILEILDAQVEKVIWTQKYQITKNTKVQIIRDISEVCSKTFKLTANGKLYILPTKNMVTYKQYLQGSQLIYDWNFHK